MAKSIARYLADVASPSGVVDGTLSTAAQTNVTSLGTLSSLVIADGGNIGSASDTDAISISSGGVVTMNQIPVLSAGLNVSGGSIAGTLSTAAQTNITSVGTLSSLTVGGNLLPSSDSAHNIGANATRFANAYFDTMYGTVGTAAQPNITSLGTLTTLTVDDITINGSTLTDAGDFEIDVGGNILLDADGGGIYFQDGSTLIGSLQNSSSDFVIANEVADKDIVFKGIDSSTTITAMTIDMSEGGRVGIGETIPLGQLHVKTADSGATADASADELVLEGSANSGMSILSGTSSTGSIYFGDSDRNWDGYIAYSHGTSPTMTIASNGGGNYIKLDHTGHVGFSSTPTAWSSGYKSIQIGDRGFVAAHTGSDLYVGQNAYIDSGWKYEASVAASLTQHSGGQITHKVAAAGTAGNAITWIDALHIKTDGNVGIGITNPLSPLSVQAASTATAMRFIGRASDSIASVGFYNNGQSADTYLQSNGSWIRGRADEGFHFRKGGTPTVTDTDGFTIEGMNLGVGATPYYPLHVSAAATANGEAKTNALFFDTTSATTGTGGGLALGGYSNGTSGDVYHFGNIQGIKENSTAGNYASAMLFSTRANGATPVEQMRIDSGGHLLIGTTDNEPYNNAADSSADGGMALSGAGWFSAARHA